MRAINQITGINRRSSFTLLELLVVVALIAILAAIAIPNLMQAHTRAKVSRVISDMRVLSGAATLYRMDHNRFPPANPDRVGSRLARQMPLVTPIAYITAPLEDVFPCRWGQRESYYPLWDPEYLASLRRVGVVTLPPELASLTDVSLVLSRGPDGDYELDPSENPDFDYTVELYDPTNGVVSSGDIFFLIR